MGLACQCGYREARQKLVATDGGAWCRELHARDFAESEDLLDWDHVSEHAHAAAKIVAPNEAAGWSRSMLDRLWNEGGESLIEWLGGELESRRGKARAAIDDLRRHLIGQRDHLDFREHCEGGWPIGTGRMESSCKPLVGVRLKGPGMHWTEAGARAMTALKATRLNSRWHSFRNSLGLST